jgi:serine protease Do
MNKKYEDWRVVFVAALTSLLVAIVVVLALTTYLWRQNSPGETVALSRLAADLTANDLVVAAVRQAKPAVVSIAITKDVPVLERWGGSNFFDDWFGLPFSLPQYREGETERREVGGGSGFLVSADGYIVTNRHVVDDDEAEYTVFTNDGEKHPAEVLAVDPVLDIAVIKIAGQNLPYLEFGEAAELEVGETAIAIGNALGEFRNTVSVGVISGLARSIVAGTNTGVVEALDEVIQTDAAINQGNSGGPLLNLAGEVVGVNVAVAAGSENIGFALPASGLREVVESVRREGKIVRPFIGVRYVAVTPELQKRNNLPVDYGVLVARGQTAADLAVIPGSPADRAGIVENDIIVEVDGQKLDSESRLGALLRSKKVGDRVTLKLLHRGLSKTVVVTLEALPDLN